MKTRLMLFSLALMLSIAGFAPTALSAEAGSQLRYDYAAESPYSLANRVKGTMRIQEQNESTWTMSFTRILKVSVSASSSGSSREIRFLTHSAIGDVTIDQPSYSETPIVFKFDVTPDAMSGTLRLSDEEIPLEQEALVSLRAMLGVGEEVTVLISERGIIQDIRPAPHASPSFTREDQEEMVRWICGQVYPVLPNVPARPGMSWTITPGKKLQEPKLNFEETMAGQTFVNRKMVDLEKFIKKQIEEQQSDGQHFGQGSGIVTPFFWPFDVTYTYEPPADGRTPPAAGISLEAAIRNAKIELGDGRDSIFANLDLSGTVFRDFQTGALEQSRVQGKADFRRADPESPPFLSFEVTADCGYAPEDES